MLLRGICWIPEDPAIFREQITQNFWKIHLKLLCWSTNYRYQKFWEFPQTLMADINVQKNGIKSCAKGWVKLSYLKASFGVSLEIPFEAVFHMLFISTCTLIFKKFLLYEISSGVLLPLYHPLVGGTNNIWAQNLKLSAFSSKLVSFWRKFRGLLSPGVYDNKEIKRRRILGACRRVTTLNDSKRASKIRFKTPSKRYVNKRGGGSQLPRISCFLKDFYRLIYRTAGPLHA